MTGKMVRWLRRWLPRRRQEPDWDGLLKAMNDAQLKADEALAEFRRIVEGAGR